MKGNFQLEHLVIYIHGKGGSSAESEHYKKFFPNDEVIGFDYKSENVWDAVSEFQDFFNLRENVTLIANSIGAFFCNARTFRKKYQQGFFYFANRRYGKFNSKYDENC